MNQKLAEARILASRKMPYMTHAVMTLIPVERRGLGTMAVDEYCRLYFDPALLEGRDLKHLIPRVTVVVDTSGSMEQSDLALALGVIGNALRSLPDPRGLRVLAGDTAVACLMQAGAAGSVPKWIDTVVLNPAN